MHSFLFIYRYSNLFFRKVYDFGAYNDWTKTNADVSS